MRQIHLDQIDNEYIGENKDHKKLQILFFFIASLQVRALQFYVYSLNFEIRWLKFIIPR